MAKFKVDLEQENFTVMTNYHLRDKNLSYKAKGLLSFMFSLPDDWDYSLKGLVAISKESKDAIRSILNELKHHHYLKIEPSRNENGTFDYDYHIFKKPFVERKKTDISPNTDFPYTVEPDMDEPSTENPPQINTNKQNTNNKIDIIDKIDKSEQTTNESKSNSVSHNILTLELIQENYVKEDSPETLYYDDLFKKFLDKGKSYKQLYSIVHYITSKVQSRNYIDENGDEITNRFGYFKNALESNINKFENMPDELYPDDKDIISDNWLDWR